MTYARAIEPHTSLIWYAAHGVQCAMCGYPVNRYFHHTVDGIYSVYAEHKTFGLKKDCLMQRGPIKHDDGS